MFHGCMERLLHITHDYLAHGPSGRAQRHRAHGQCHHLPPLGASVQCGPGRHCGLGAPSAHGRGTYVEASEDESKTGPAPVSESRGVWTKFATTWRRNLPSFLEGCLGRLFRTYGDRQEFRILAFETRFGFRALDRVCVGL